MADEDRLDHSGRTAHVLPLADDQRDLAIADLPGARFPNFTKRPGAQYPHAIEAAGSVLITYSVNQESIQIVKVPCERLARGQAFR